MNRLKITISTIIFTIFSQFITYAPPSGSWNPGDTEPTVPIHGGLIFLLGLGISYLTVKIFPQKKK